MRKYFFSFLFILLWWTVTYGKEWHVETTQELFAIQLKLKAGDSIVLADGDYYISQPFYINQTSVKLHGHKKSQNAKIICTQEFNEWPGAAITVGKEDVIIQDLTVANCLTGIYTGSGADNFKANRLFVSNSRYGIYPMSRNYKIQNSFINGSAVAGVKPTDANSIGIISDTTISFSGYAIWVQFGNKLKVEGCRIVNNTHPFLATNPVGELKVVDTIFASNRLGGDLCNRDWETLIPTSVLHDPRGASFRCSSCNSFNSTDAECKYHKPDHDKSEDKHEDDDADDEEGYNVLYIILEVLFGNFWITLIRRLIAQI